MKLPNKNSCDRCGKSYEVPYGRTVKYSTGKEMDVSGNGYNSVEETIDLCFDCVDKLLIKVVTSKSGNC